MEDLDDALKCAICWEPMIATEDSPLLAPTTNVCGHTFCRGCVLGCVTGNQPCPLCKEPFVSNWGMPTSYMMATAFASATKIRDELVSTMDAMATMKIALARARAQLARKTLKTIKQKQVKSKIKSTLSKPGPTTRSRQLALQQK